VVVTTVGGSATAVSAYTYISPPGGGPTSPNQGTTAGGTTVTLTGVNFANALSVTFGGLPATITSNTPTSITVITPAHAAGAVDWVLTTLGGSYTNSNGFFYIAPPTITNVSSNVGPTSGGNTVNLSGTNLLTATSVNFGSNTATPTIISDSLLSVVVPASGFPGNVSVGVTTAGGTAIAPGGYTYVDAPTINSLAPTSGSTLGGTTVTISGTSLSSASQVTFDGVPASFGVINNSTISAITPAGAAGAVDVVVTTAGGSATAVGAFTYVIGGPRIPLGEIDARFGPMDGFVDDPAVEVLQALRNPPSLTSLTPSAGPEAGGNSVVIAGAGLTGVGGVWFGTVPASSFVVNSDTQITAVAPPGVGTVQVRVVRQDTPIITALTPSSGPESGETSVVITGRNFAGATSVRFGSTAMSFVVNSDTQITTVTPAGSGPVNVTVTTAYGTSAPLTYLYIGGNQQQQNNDDDDDDKPETREQRQQREDTNQGNKDDVYTEGSVVEVHLDENPPRIVIGNKDGQVTVILQCGSQCPSISVGQYVEIDGVKENESLFYADEVTVSK
jgi:hypothetical protein